jgi:hypothetical protein
MRRLLLAVAAAAVAACASTPRPPAEAAAPPPPPPGAPSAPEPGESVATLDLTGDGKPDVWTFTRPGPDGKPMVTRKEKDLNGDGRVDSWERYGPDGALTLLVYDMDFDGKPDATLHFEKDQLVRKEYAFGVGGVTRVQSFYENGQLVRKERDTNGDGKVDAWEYWENGQVDRIGRDLDGDGKVDRWESRAAAAPDATRPDGQK